MGRESVIWGCEIAPLDVLDIISFFFVFWKSKLHIMTAGPCVLLWNFNAQDHEMTCPSPVFKEAMGGGCLTVWITSSVRGSQMNRSYEGGFGGQGISMVIYCYAGCPLDLASACANIRNQRLCSMCVTLTLSSTIPRSTKLRSYLTRCYFWNRKDWNLNRDVNISKALHT